MVQTRLQSGAHIAPRKRSSPDDDETKSTQTPKKQRTSKIKNEKTSSNSNTKSKAAPKPTKKTTKQSRIPTKQSRSSPSASSSPPALKTETDNKDASNSDDGHDEHESIIINRAPVLHLWAACVAQKLHPSFSWQTSLSAGAAISTLCAISKGRAIGVVEAKETDNTTAAGEDRNKKKKETKKRSEVEEEEVQIMQFKLRVKDGKVFVGDKAQGAGEEALRRKFGGEQYGAVKAAFDEALATWEDSDTEELGGRAFKMYETFRPDVNKGQKGWGRKGELDLEHVKSVVSKS